MANDKVDQFALTTPAGLPAYPQVIYADTDEKYPDGSPKRKILGTAKDPEEHKKLLKEGSGPAWGKDK